MHLGVRKMHYRIFLTESSEELLRENEVTGVVYKVGCGSFSFVFIGDSKRSWNSRGQSTSLAQEETK